MKKQIVASTNGFLGENYENPFDIVDSINFQFYEFNPRVKLTTYRGKFYITVKLNFDLDDSKYTENDKALSMRIFLTDIDFCADLLIAHGFKVQIVQFKKYTK